MNVRRCKVSGRGEVPSVGANLDGEGGAVTKVENHGLRGVHSPARLDLSVLYGRYRPSDTAHLTLAWLCPSRPGTSSRLWREFIVASSPRATVEDARRPLQGACKANPALRPPGSSSEASRRPRRV